MYLEQAFKGENKFINYLLSIIFIFLMINTLGAVPMIIGNMFPQYADSFSIGISQDIKLIYLLFPFAIGAIATLFAVKRIHKKNILSFLTARKSFDFKRAGKGAIIWSIILLISSIPTFLSSDSIVFNFQPVAFIILVLITIFLLIFQTSFEEFLFRGYLMQGFAVATKTRWAPLLITSVIFGLMHISNPEVKEFGVLMTMPTYIIYGLVMGLVVVMDNGLEIALGMHFANNALSSLLFTTTSSVLQTPALFLETKPTVSMTDNIIMLGSSITFLVVCAIVFKWKDWGKIFRKIEVEK
jgi:membrane protease YdiL (CAAX protease family)